MPVNETIERIVYEGVDKITAVSRQAADSQKRLASAIDGVKTALASVGVTVGAGAMVQLYMDTLKATAALDDMAEATGASVEGLSAIQRVAKVGGQDFEGLTSQIGKMIKGLKEGGDEGNKTARALDFLGVKAKDADGRFRDQSQVLIEVAQKLELYEDGGNKVALVQDILQKGGERYLPLLKDIAEGTDLHATVTAKQAAEAERLEKNINRLTVALGGARREIVTGTTPAMITLTDRMLEANKAGGLFLATMRAAADVASRIGGVSPIGILGRATGAGIDAAAARNRPAGSQADVRRVENALAPAKRLTYTSPDEGAETRAQREREFLARQLEEGVEEERRIRSEAAALTASFRANETEQMRKFLALDLQETDDYYKSGGAALIAYNDERNRILIERYDRERELAIERGETDAASPTHTAKLEALRQSLLLEDELELEADQRRFEKFLELSDAELAVYGGRYALIEGMNSMHQAKMLNIENRKHQAQRSMEQGTFSLAAGLLQQFAGKSREAALAVIAITKGLSIAQTMQATAVAIMRAYADLGPIAGSVAAAKISVLGYIQLGLIAATGLVEAGNIGGGSSAQGTFPASPITGLPATPVESGAPAVAGGGTRREFTLIIRGEGPAGRLIAEDLAQQLLELKKDGGFPALFEARTE